MLQPNGFDCGVFVCRLLKHLAEKKDARDFEMTWSREERVEIGLSVMEICNADISAVIPQVETREKVRKEDDSGNDDHKTSTDGKGSKATRKGAAAADITFMSQAEWNEEKQQLSSSLFRSLESKGIEDEGLQFPEEDLKAAGWNESDVVKFRSYHQHVFGNSRRRHLVPPTGSSAATEKAFRLLNNIEARDLQLYMEVFQNCTKEQVKKVCSNVQAWW